MLRCQEFLWLEAEVWTGKEVGLCSDFACVCVCAKGSRSTEIAQRKLNGSLHFKFSPGA